MNRNLAWEASKHILIAILIFLTLYPFIFLIISSMKSHDEFTHNFLGLPQNVRPENYRAAWKVVKQYVFNSIIMSSTTVAMVVLLSSYVGFIFARYRFPGKEFLFYTIIGLLMIPGALTLIPQFIIVKNLGLLNTRWACILPWTSGGQVFAIFVSRSFMASLPEELFESARIDGANTFQLYSKIALPLSYSTCATIGTMHFVGTWNDIIWPLVTITKAELRPVTTGILAFQGAYYQNYGPLFAGYILASLPLIILFLFTMRYYIRGLLSGAIKM
ncbi:MAG: carbohydrate ABC transporter permease [bacterium]